MTYSQMKIALLSARLGSISAAARELALPQPNASSSIRALESELGFEIFKRSGSGIILTEKGEIFISHAERILEENERISRLKEAANLCSLKVGCTNVFRGKDAFIRFVSEHSGDDLANLQYYNVSIEEGLQLLYDERIHILAAVTISSVFSVIREKARDKKLECLEIDQLLPMITLRKEHPLVVSGTFSENSVDINALRDYPHVAYQNLNADFSSPNYKAVFEIPCKYSIFVDEKELRQQIASATDAFRLGVETSKTELDRFGLVQFPYPGYELTLCALYRSANREKPEVKRFLELLSEK